MILFPAQNNLIDIISFFTTLLASLPLYAASTYEDPDIVYNRARLHLVAKSGHAFSFLKQASELGHPKAKTEYPVRLWESAVKSKDVAKQTEALREILPILFKLETQEEWAQKLLFSLRSMFYDTIGNFKVEGVNDTNKQFIYFAAEFGSIEAQIYLMTTEEKSVWNAQALKKMSSLKIDDKDALPWEQDLKEYLSNLPYLVPTMEYDLLGTFYTKQEELQQFAATACRNLCRIHLDNEPFAFMFLKQLEALTPDIYDEPLAQDADSSDRICPPELLEYIT